jgi:hypothetical protein
MVMAQTQPRKSGSILVFRPAEPTCASLTIRDRMQVEGWRESARDFGYDRLVIHEHQPGDPPEVGSFLSVYRCGEPWARFGVTRMGDSIVAWCSTTSVNLGRFASIGQALLALLPEQAPRQIAVLPVKLIRRRRRWRRIFAGGVA